MRVIAGFKGSNPRLIYAVYMMSFVCLLLKACVSQALRMSPQRPQNPAHNHTGHYHSRNTETSQPCNSYIVAHIAVTAAATATTMPCLELARAWHQQQSPRTRRSRRCRCLLLPPPLVWRRGLPC